MPGDHREPRSLVIALLLPDLRRAAIAPADIDDGFNVIDSGVVDSLGFLELVTNLERRANVQLDLFDADPDVLTTVGGLVELLCHARQTKASFMETDR